MRRKKHPAPPTAIPNAAAAIPPAAPGQAPAPYPPNQPPMGMAPPAGAPGAFDPAYNMAAKPPVLYGGVPLSPGAASPGGSPPPVYQPQMQAMGAVPGMGTPPPHGMGMATPPPQHMMGTPPPQQPGQYYAPYPGQPVQQGYPQQQPAVELPTQRSDGQVHELS